VSREQEIARRVVERLQPETRRLLATAGAALPVPLAGGSAGAWYALALFCEVAGVDPREIFQALMEALHEGE
jgi:hypothetical protein